MEDRKRWRKKQEVGGKKGIRQGGRKNGRIKAKEGRIKAKEGRDKVREGMKR